MMGRTFALELINVASEDDIKRQDLYDGAPLLITIDPRQLPSPWVNTNTENIPSALGKYSRLTKNF